MWDASRQVSLRENRFSPQSKHVNPISTYFILFFSLKLKSADLRFDILAAANAAQQHGSGASMARFPRNSVASAGFLSLLMQSAVPLAGGALSSRMECGAIRCARVPLLAEWQKGTKANKFPFFSFLFFVRRFGRRGYH